jgi:hypothetical protein
MKTTRASALICAVAITALIHASPTAAKPDMPSNDTACGTTFESWMAYTLDGVQWHDDGPYRWPFPTRIDIGFDGTDGTANWRVKNLGGTKEIDRVWIEGDSARFRSASGTARGAMIDFTLHSPVCDELGLVVSAHVRTHVPTRTAGVRMYQTLPGEPLKAI